jgi:phosphoribosylanthranilate isomerase
MVEKRVYCKICDIRDFQTAQLCAQLGADFIGLHAIWQIKQGRLADFQHIAQIIPKIYPSTHITLVTRQQDVHIVATMAEMIKPSWIQLHAPWSPNSISDLRQELRSRGLNNIQLIGVVALEDESSCQLVSKVGSVADLLLLDRTYRGGTGQTVEIALLKHAMSLAASTPVLIAGGLTPENVAHYLRILRPYGVDVQTGVEYPDKPGVKDPERIKAFLQAIHKEERNI